MTSQVNQIDTPRKATFLTTILRADGLFSLASAAVTILAAGTVAELIELETPIALVILGFILIGYGGMLLFFADREPVNLRIAQIAIVLNMLWVADSYAGLLLGFYPVNTAGKWAIALVAEVVFLFGILQIVALRRANK